MEFSGRTVEVISYGAGGLSAKSTTSVLERAADGSVRAPDAVADGAAAAADAEQARAYARAYVRAPAPALIELLQAGVILALLARKRRSARALRIRFVVRLARRRCAALRCVLIGRARLGLGRTRLIHMMQSDQHNISPSMRAAQLATICLFGWAG